MRIRLRECTVEWRADWRGVPIQFVFLVLTWRVHVHMHGALTLLVTEQSAAAARSLGTSSQLSIMCRPARQCGVEKPFVLPQLKISAGHGQGVAAAGGSADARPCIPGFTWKSSLERTSFAKKIPRQALSS